MDFSESPTDPLGGGGELDLGLLQRINSQDERVSLRVEAVRLSCSLAYIGTRLRELEIIPYMVQTYT